MRQRWIAAFVLGELVGFVPPALTGAGLASAGVADPFLVLGLVVAVLSPHVRRSAVWAPVTAGAWFVGVLIPVTALSLVPNGWPLLSHVIVGVAAAVAMGATGGADTARTLSDLLSRAGRPVHHAG